VQWSTVAVAVVVTLGIFMLAWSGMAAAQQNDLESRKTALEVQKLKLEVRNLKNPLSVWLVPALGVVAGVVAGVITFGSSAWVSRVTRHGGLDQSVHEKRLELYPGLVKTTETLALYFPSVPSVSQEECHAMGNAMREWYFGNGLILSDEARDAYFMLARALTLASLAEELRVPDFASDAEKISGKNVEEYRKELRFSLADLNEAFVEEWSFGDSASAGQEVAFEFRDFVFLQSLSSKLRTTLSKDLRSRRRPASE